MNRRIDLLLSQECGYTYETYCSHKVAQILEKKEIPYKKIYLNRGVLNDYLVFVERDPPEQWLGFAPLIPLCDLFDIPQSVWAESSIAEVKPHLSFKRGKVFLPTPTPQAHCIPHGVERCVPHEPLFDTVFFSPLVDIENLKERWREFFPEATASLLERGEAPQDDPTGHLLAAAEEYLKAKRAFSVISTASTPLHVFGEHIGNNWYRRLANAAHIYLHAPLPYTEHFSVMRQSRIVILDPLDWRWSVTAAAAGAVPLLADREDLHDEIKALLADSKKRDSELKKYQNEIEALTWENQVSHLIKQLYED